MDSIRSSVSRNNNIFRNNNVCNWGRKTTFPSAFYCFYSICCCCFCLWFYTCFVSYLAIGRITFSMISACCCAIYTTYTFHVALSYAVPSRLRLLHCALQPLFSLIWILHTGGKWFMMTWWDIECSREILFLFIIPCAVDGVSVSFLLILFEYKYFAPIFYHILVVFGAKLVFALPFSRSFFLFSPSGHSFSVYYLTVA